MPNPFADPQEMRDPARRFRGRLGLPVTVWTAAAGGRRAGLTVSSLLVAEGDPASVMGLIGPLSDFWEVASESGRFVVHVLAEGQGRIADRFAGRYPERPFDRVRADDGAWGPELAEVPTRARCTVTRSAEAGWFLLVSATVDAVELGPAEEPLLYVHGGYAAARPRH